MIEPTESESKDELDRFCDAMIAIRAEIRAVEEGRMPREDNPLRNAPHTAAMLLAQTWTHPYTREQAAFPLELDRERLRLDLDDAVAASDLERRARLEGSFAADLARNHEAAGRVHGNSHGSNNTMNHGWAASGRWTRFRRLGYRDRSTRSGWC